MSEMISLQRYKEYKKLELPWLFEIPTHWEMKRAKQLFKTIDVRSSTGQEELLSVSANLGVVKRADANVTMFKAESYIGYKLCWPEDLAVNSLWAWQKGLGFSKNHGIISTAYSVYRLRNKQDYNYKYYDYYVRSSAYSWELRVRSKGIWRSRYQLLDVNFFDSPMICPPKEEQDQIVRYLDSKLAKINKFIRNKKRLIELLKEQKQAVINQAVTKGLDPDTKMKPSGIQWLGDVPEEWEVVKLKSRFSILAGCGFPIHLQGKQEGDYPFFKASDINKQEMYVEKANNYVDALTVKTNNFTVVNENAILMAKIGEALKKNHRKINIVKCIIDNNLQAMVLKSGINIKYAYYLLRCIDMSWFDNGGTVPSINNNKLMAIKIPLPNGETQASIVVYVETQTQTIDTTIDRIQKEIDLISEYRTSLISAVVTGKVDIRGIKVEEPPAEDLAALEPAELEADELQEDEILESEVG
jgi:type I restriction enzyme, S subunit